MQVHGHGLNDQGDVRMGGRGGPGAVGARGGEAAPRRPPSPAIFIDERGTRLRLQFGEKKGLRGEPAAGGASLKV